MTAPDFAPVSERGRELLALCREGTLAEAEDLIRSLCRQAAAFEDIATQQTGEAEVFRLMAVEGIHALADKTTALQRAEATIERQRDEIRTLRAELERYTRRVTTEAA
jgi:hypothetical protein